MSELPTFRYHPDPLATGEVVPSENSCRCCGQQRGYLYTGPVYCVEPVRGEICPWCVADGSAAARYDAHFTDAIRAPAEVSEPMIAELLTTTPGFLAWQQPYWLYHCADAAAFLGRVGYAELKAVPEALEMVLHENDEFHWSAEQSDRYVRSLDPDGEATGYLFRCLHCSEHLAYTDMS